MTKETILSSHRAKTRDILDIRLVWSAPWVAALRKLDGCAQSQYRWFCHSMFQINRHFIVIQTLIISPPLGLGDLLFFTGRPSVRPSVCLSATSSHGRSITWKPLYKQYSWNFKQISIKLKRCAECKSHISCFHTFWDISIFGLCQSQSWVLIVFAI